MLRIERAGKRLIGFDDLARKPIGELYDLTDFVVNSPEAFFGEAGERLFVLGAHVRLAPGDRTAVDVLGMDAEGSPVAVVIEGAAAESPLTRAVAAAGRLAAWPAEDFFRLLAPKRARELRAFLGPNVSAVNRRQRVLIVGERADEEAIAAAAWLRTRGADIGYIEAAMATDPRTGEEYLRCRAIGPRIPGSPPPTRAAGPLEGAQAPATGAPSAGEPAWEPLPSPEALFEDAADNPRADRRRADRRLDFKPANVEIEYAGRRMSAVLADYGPDGVGLEMNHPLPIGSIVRVRASIERPEGPLQLDSVGRVRHCRFGDRAFRLGVAFERAASTGRNV